MVLYDMRDLRKISKYLMIWFIANLLNDWYEFDEFIGWKLQLNVRYIFLHIELELIHTKVHYLSFEFDDVFPSDIYIKMPEVVIYSLNILCCYAQLKLLSILRLLEPSLCCKPTACFKWNYSILYDLIRKLLPESTFDLVNILSVDEF